MFSTGFFLRVGKTRDRVVKSYDFFSFKANLVLFIYRSCYRAVYLEKHNVWTNGRNVFFVTLVYLALYLKEVGM